MTSSAPRSRLVSPKHNNIRYVLHWDPLRKIFGESLWSDFRLWVGTACFDNPKSCLSTPFLELLKWVLAELFSFAFPRNPVLIFSPGTRLLMAFPAFWNLSSGYIRTCCYLESWHQHHHEDLKGIISLLNMLFLLDLMILEGFSHLNDSVTPWFFFYAKERSLREESIQHPMRLLVLQEAGVVWVLFAAKQVKLVWTCCI